MFGPIAKPAIQFFAVLRTTFRGLMTVVAAYLAQADVRHFFSPSMMINVLWLIFAAYWLISAFKRKRTKSRESMLQRLSYVLPLWLMWMLLFRGSVKFPSLNIRFVSDTAAVSWIGTALTAAGIAIACWPRSHL